jgi:hypothetical protein
MYALRVVGLKTEFYRLSAEDTRIAMPALEKQGRVAATDDIDGAMEKLDTHFATQLIKAAATLAANDAAKRSRGSGAAP